MLFRWLLFFSLTGLYASCNNCRCIDNDNLSFNFINYDSIELDTIIIRKYQKASGFAQLVDTGFYDGNDFRVKITGDTVSFPIRVGNFSLSPQFDYVLVLPGAGRRNKSNRY